MQVSLLRMYYVQDLQCCTIVQMFKMQSAHYFTTVQPSVEIGGELLCCSMSPILPGLAHCDILPLDIEEGTRR